MPKSKRSKIVSLTKTAKKGKEAKASLMEEVRTACQQFAFIHVFTIDNMRNNAMKHMRTEFGDQGRFFYGRNKVMAKALGLTKEDEIVEGSAAIGAKLIGEVGLLMSNKGPEDVSSFFDGHDTLDYARGGGIAPSGASIPAGPVMRGELPMPHNMEPHLRSLGMPTLLANGVVTLSAPYTICKPGDVLSPEQAHLLKHFGFKFATFKAKLKSSLHNSEFTEYQ